MKTYLLSAALIAASVSFAPMPALAQSSGTAAGAVDPGDNVVHSNRHTRRHGDKNNVSQDGTSVRGGGSMGGAQSTEAQGMGAAAGGSTGGAKSNGR